MQKAKNKATDGVVCGRAQLPFASRTLNSCSPHKEPSRQLLPIYVQRGRKGAGSAMAPEGQTELLPRIHPRQIWGDTLRLWKHYLR